MRRALELAGKGVGLVSPGALVGAVIVREGVIVGESFYTYDGVDHAETRALRQAGDRARGATVYVTLEPCSHFGRTPPCADALIEAGVTRVVCAMVDPNPNVNGKGIEKLRAAGVHVETGVLEHEARRQNEAFIVYKSQKRPFGILKLAMTLDGKIATRAGESQWITSEESRNLAQELRHSVDAIVTGSGTFLKDQPQMTDRTGLPRRRPLLRVVLDRRGRVGTPPDWLVFSGSLQALSAELAARDIQSFLLECGPELAFNAAEAGIMDKVVAFIAPKLLGGSGVLAFGGAGFDRLRDAITLEEADIKPVGSDFVLTAYFGRRPTGVS
jgi:diaminohydroxyphosphoribosylaminopyrimidine deaminase/5-amino-6-(5-phosphoribosylamino)uracil reductase